MAMLAAIFGLCAVGIYLITSRSLSRIVLGFGMLGHATVLGLLIAGGPAGDPPLADRTSTDTMANPLPQALALTAIVIAFGLTLFLLGLARRQRQLTGEDLVEDDLEDRRVAELGDWSVARTDLGNLLEHIDETELDLDDLVERPDGGPNPGAEKGLGR